MPGPHKGVLSAASMLDLCRVSALLCAPRPLSNLRVMLRAGGQIQMPASNFTPTGRFDKRKLTEATSSSISGAETKKMEKPSPASSARFGLLSVLKVADCVTQLLHTTSWIRGQGNSPPVFVFKLCYIDFLLSVSAHRAFYTQKTDYCGGITDDNVAGEQGGKEGR
ncbi:hypothetical protein GOODEAATRI_012407 [Goodea atripinnis]|uniref:Uncharacterized protein n=1 Tax=Goodea atripinnis TaxID=208336 RepID=A0ABV0PXW7_9TELE